MSDSAIPQWKKDLIARLRSQNRRTAQQLFSQVSAVQQPAPVGRERCECSEKMVQERSSDDEDLHYGPGIVNKLKERYLSLAQREKPRPSILRRAASLEDLLDDAPEKERRFRARESKAPTRYAARGSGELKRARSVETISVHEREGKELKRESMHEEMLIKGSAIGQEKPAENGEYTRINRPKRIAPVMNEKEKPPTDVVKQAKMIFERRPEQRTKAPQHTGEVAAKVASYKNIIVQNKPKKPAIKVKPSVDKSKTNGIRTKKNGEVNKATEKNLRPKSPEKKFSPEVLRPKSPDKKFSPEVLPKSPDKKFPQEVLRPKSPDKKFSSEVLRPKSPDKKFSSEVLRPKSPDKKFSSEVLRPKSPDKKFSSEVLRPKSPDKKFPPEVLRPKSPDKKFPQEALSPKSPEKKFPPEVLSPKSPEKKSFPEVLRPKSPEKKSFPEVLRPKSPEKKFVQEILRPKSPEKKFPLERQISVDIPPALPPRSPEKKFLPDLPKHPPPELKLSSAAPSTKSPEKSQSLPSPIPDISRVDFKIEENGPKSTSLTETPDLIITSSPLPAVNSPSFRISATENFIKEEIRLSQTERAHSDDNAKPPPPSTTPAAASTTNSMTFNFAKSNAAAKSNHLPTINKNVLNTQTPPSQPLKLEINGFNEVAKKSPNEEKVLVKQGNLTSLEIEKNLINAAKTLEQPKNNSVVANEVTNVVKVPKVKRPPREPENNTIVFKFTDRKDVPDYVQNDGVKRVAKLEKPKVGEGGIILLPGASVGESFTDEDEEILRSLEGPPSPCDVTFINDNILIDGKSSLSQKAKKAKLKISFVDEGPEIYEYPSESSLLIEETPISPPVAQIRHSVPSLSGGSSLANYTPKSTEDFQPGVTRSVQPVSKPETPDTADLILQEVEKPILFSAGANTDILF